MAERLKGFALHTVSDISRRLCSTIGGSALHTRERLRCYDVDQVEAMCHAPSSRAPSLRYQRCVFSCEDARRAAII